MRQENISLRNKFKELERDKGHLTINIEELELKVEAMNKTIIDLKSENTSLGIRLEVSKGQMSNEMDKFNTQSQLLKVVEDQKEALNAKVKEKEVNICKLEKEAKDKDDNLLISEYTLKNRDDTIKSLKVELDALKAAECFQCAECDFSDEKESELKLHIDEQHSHHCQHCDVTFVGVNKLEKHICRIQVSNPSSDQFGLYTKNWYERNKCIRVFDNASKVEIILLHSEHCLGNVVCTELPLEFHKEKCYKDSQGLIHIRAQDFLEANNMRWMHILGMKLMFNSR